MREVFIFRSVSRGGIQRIRKIPALSFEEAKEMAIEKFSHVKYFKHSMDLITALKKAAEASKKFKKAYYIIVDEEDGECSINTAPIGTATHKFVDGTEDKAFKVKHKPEKEQPDEVVETPQEVEENKVSKKSKQKEVMAKTKQAVKTAKTKKVAPKKVAVKKVAAKKVAAKITKKIEGAKIVSISIANMRAGIKKGFKYYDPQGVSQNDNYLKTRANQEHVRDNMQEVKPAE